jgi:nitrate/nitrite transport system substrate-binding protein
MLTSPPNYKAIADKLIMSDLYEEVAKSMGVPVSDDMKPFKTNLETITFDPNNPAAYVAGAKK